MLRAKFLADHRSEVKLPDPNGLVTNFEPPLYEKLGNVTESELVPELLEHCHEHDVCRER